MVLIFARHGQSEANVARVISNRGYQHGLTELGRSQAASLAVLLAGSGAERIFTSPLRRAVETAAVVSAVLGVPTTVTDALREYDCGEIEGRADAEGWRRWADLREDWFARGRRDARIPGGESFEDMRARFVPFIEGLLAGPDVTSILVGHGGIFTCMLPLVMDNVDPDFARSAPFPNTETVRAETAGGRLVCREWCGIVL